ncbi:MAG TPA: ATP-binding protein [Gaiellaceae bacterium]|nr:ATP-binding protein [Gaiellaceae bacterium]
MESVANVLDYVNLGLLTLVALTAVWLWRRGRGRAALWAAITFGTLAFVVDFSRFLPEDPETTLEQVGQRALLVALVLFPYLLYRFAVSFEPPARRVRVATALLTLAMVAWTIALPELPGEDEPEPAWFTAYVIGFVVHWTLLTAVVAGRLWRGRRGQPTVVRRRMQLIGLAVAAITVALLLSAFSDEGNARVQLAAGILVTVSALGFLVGLAPPAALRLIWRRPETVETQAAISRLMTATSEADVAREVLPPMARMVGARAVALRDAGGRVIGTHGASAEMLADAHASATHDEHGRVVVLDVPSGSLVVWTNPYAPFFGREELALLRSLGALTGLALDRSRLFAHERAAREALERADELKSNFIALAAHELRTPVTAIDGIVQTLHSRSADLGPERRAALEETLAAQSTNMRGLVDQLLDLSRLDAEAVAINPRTVLVRERLESVVTSAAGVRADDVVLEVDEGLEVTVDPAALDRIVSNLVTNALRYGQPPVVVRAERADRHFRLAVEDSGPGVPDEFVPSLFERFTRSRTGRDRVTGTGLGLAIARSYAAAHGGDLIYEPADPTGARFRLVIPLQ